jgi:histidinol phosphatase-like PHP family hydrolase|tara:strand:+ start:15167 stop:16147 length:981 start_codon:yes stop_codon:yes gene_type:complete
MAEIFSPPLIQAKTWEEAQRKFNEVIRQLSRQFNNIYTGANIPTDRIKDDSITETKIADDSIATPHLQANCVTSAKVIADSITSGKISVTDLVDIVNLLTIASGRIVIGADAIGSGLDGIVINDGTRNRVEIGEYTADTYGIRLYDSSGVLWNNAGESQLVWQEVYDNILTSAATSVTISSLTGDTDHIYHIYMRVVNDYNGVVNYTMRPNNDSTADKDYQWVRADGAAVTSNEVADQTGMVLLTTDAQDKVGVVWGQLYAKAGEVRTLLHLAMENQTTTDAGQWWSRAGMWSGTAGEITSLVILADQTNGLGVGTHISVYKIKSF